MHKISLQALYMAVAAFFAVLTIMWPQQTYAAPITSKAVSIRSSLPNANTNHTFNFTAPSVSSVGSIELEYCSNSPFVGEACTVPPGLSLGSATLQNQTGETGYSISPASTVNRIVLSRVAVPTSGAPASYSFDNVINHSAPNSTVYVRIATYASTNGTGPRIDTGAVAYATVSMLAVAGYVPPYITFCVGVTVTLNCSSSTGVFLNFGEFVTNQTRSLSSQFSVATNDPAGYATTVSGLTMTSGNNTIAALNTPRPSLRGTSQFGMNLRSNTNPSVGADPTGVGTGAIANGFNIPNQFFFNNQIVASSPISSDFNAFTVSYVVNVNGSQQPGIYSTTLTYIASAAF